MKFLKKLIWILKNIEYTEDSMTIGCKINLCQDVNMNYRRITNLSNPFDSSDATSKFYTSGVQESIVFTAIYDVSSFSEILEHYKRNGVVMVDVRDNSSSNIYHLSRIDYDDSLGKPCKYYFRNGENQVGIDWHGVWTKEKEGNN